MSSCNVTVQRPLHQLSVNAHVDSTAQRVYILMILKMDILDLHMSFLQRSRSGVKKVMPKCID
jgi:hypothetical protein